MTSRPTLAAAFDPRVNALNFLRLALATSVIVGHAAGLTGFDLGRWQDLILNLPVDGFFALSGFLITRSWDRRPIWGRYLWHRALRIFPAFWVCLVVTAFVIAPMGTWLMQGSLDGFWGTPHGPFSYVWKNSLLYMNQYGIDPYQNGWNIPLWTLYWEFLCYLGLGVLGVLGIVPRHRRLVLVILLVLWAVLLTRTLFPHLDAQYFATRSRQDIVRLPFMFLCGSVLYLYSARIPLTRGLATLALALFLASYLLLPDFRVAGGLPLAYLLLWLGVHLPVRIGLRTDVSYGMYIYGWPMQQMLLIFGWGSVAWLAFSALSVAVTVPLAFASWSGVERWALRLKNWTPGRRSVAPDPGEPPAAQGGLGIGEGNRGESLAADTSTQAWAIAGVAVMITLLVLDLLLMLRGSSPL